MIVASASTLSWLDSSEHERRNVLELVSALNEPGTLDELGIGTIRDTIADTLFPGTSTIQTRARYLLFIPWILKIIEEGSPRGTEDRAKRLQLCYALEINHGTRETGVIGREAKSALQRWPLSIYWLGLARWGICCYPGSLQSYFEALRRPPSWHVLGRALEEPVEGRRNEAADDAIGNWASIPNRPANFPEDASFTLTAEEGRFLRERVVLTHPQSYLAHILQTGNTGDSSSADFPWRHTAADTTSPTVKEWLNDARLLSLVHQGGVLLYNLMLARGLNEEDRIFEFSNRLDQWSALMAVAHPDLERWDRDSMWNRLLRANPGLRTRTLGFVNRWCELTITTTDQSIKDRTEAHSLIRERERALKGARARLTYAEARDRRRGYPTSARLEFRWSQVKRITSDILAALEQD